jgi:hypothetical protein
MVRFSKQFAHASSKVQKLALGTRAGGQIARKFSGAPEGLAW